MDIQQYQQDQGSHQQQNLQPIDQSIIEQVRDKVYKFANYLIGQLKSLSSQSTQKQLFVLDNFRKLFRNEQLRYTNERQFILAQQQNQRYVPQDLVHPTHQCLCKVIKKSQQCKRSCSPCRNDTLSQCIQGVCCKKCVQNKQSFLRLKQKIYTKLKEADINRQQGRHINRSQNIVINKNKSEAIHTGQHHINKIEQENIVKSPETMSICQSSSGIQKNKKIKGKRNLTHLYKKPVQKNGQPFYKCSCHGKCDSNFCGCVSNGRQCSINCGCPHNCQNFGRREHKRQQMIGQNPNQSQCFEAEQNNYGQIMQEEEQFNYVDEQFNEQCLFTAPPSFKSKSSKKSGDFK